MTLPDAVPPPVGDARSLAGTVVAAIGPGTAAELARFGIGADVIPDLYGRPDAVGAMYRRREELAIDAVERGRTATEPLTVLDLGCGAGRASVALAVRGSADDERALALEHRAVEPVHEERLDLGLAVVERELHLLRAELRRAGHRADENGDAH